MNAPPDSPARRPKHWAIRLACNLALAAGYFLLAKLGLQLATLHGNVSPFWPATGYAIAVISVGGNRRWPAIALGAFLANATTPVSFAAAAVIAAGNVLEACAGSALHRAISGQIQLEPFATPLAWIASSLFAPLISAAIGVGSLWATGTVPLGMARGLWVTWWTGDSIGALLIAPLLCAWHESWRRGWTFRFSALWQVALVSLCAAGVCYWVFFHPGGAMLLFLIFPVLFVAGLFFAVPGIHLTCLVMALLCIFATARNGGPFTLPGLNDTLLELEPFLFALGVTALVLSVLRRHGYPTLPGLVLLGGWAFSGWMFSTVQTERQHIEKIRLENLISDVQDAIRHRLAIYVDALRGGVSLFAASDYVDRDEWRRYVESLDLVKRYPGIHGVGAMFPLRVSEMDAFLTRMRADGVPDFHFHDVPGAHRPPPDPAGWDAFVITYLEPQKDNEGALGLDVTSETKRLTAARVSRDSGRPQISARIALVQDGESRPGFLLFVPIYAPDTLLETVHQRRLASRGWVFAPFVTEEFLQGILGPRERAIELSFFEGLAPVSSQLLFTTEHPVPAHFDRLTVLQLAGQQFRLGWNRGPDFQNTEGEPLLNAASLALVPALLAGLVLSLQTTGRRAGELATERTRELREVNEKLETQVQERLRAEQDAQSARAAAEAANSAKSDFLATMSHEIRTPMNSVIGYADLLTDSPLTDEQKEWAASIQSSGRTLLALINDILDFSKIEAGKLQLEMIPFDPQAAAQEVLDIMHSLAKPKNLPLLFEAGPSVPKGVQGDPVRFKQILINLISNAIKFTEKGSVRIQLTWQPEASGGLLRTTVSDTGMGIPTEKQNLLFQKFSQTDTSTTRRFGGTGLGLAICKHLVELMGGRIEVASQLGAGTSIGFTVPFALAPTDNDIPKNGALPETSTGARYEILLVEDLAINRRLASTLLERLGCHVETAADGHEAIRQFEPGRYDLIFMDCQMPGMDGFDASRAIRLREPAGSHVPIIAVTANAMEGDRARCLAAGMDDYITKPFAKKDFIRVLARWAVHQEAGDAAGAGASAGAAPSVGASAGAPAGKATGS